MECSLLQSGLGSTVIGGFVLFYVDQCLLDFICLQSKQLQDRNEVSKDSDKRKGIAPPEQDLPEVFLLLEPPWHIEAKVSLFLFFFYFQIVQIILIFVRGLS